MHRSRVRANSLCILIFYLGGSAGIPLGGFANERLVWAGASGMGRMLLAAIFLAGVLEARHSVGAINAHSIP